MSDTISLSELLQEKYILAVDDQQVIRMMLKNFLSQLGVGQAQIKSADDGDAALKVVEELQGSVGFILLDWNMPRIPGIEVLRTIRANPATRKTPILMVTAETKEEQILQALEEGINGYLIKPFIASDLGEKMTNILNPQKYTKFIETAESLIEDGEYEKATTILEKVLASKQNSASARMLMGLANKHLGNDVEAKKWYEEAVEKNPKFLKALNSLSEFLMEKGDMDNALRIMTQADQMSPLVANRKVNIGKINLELGDEKKAIEAFSNAAVLDPKTAEEIANTCLEKGNTEMAYKYLNQLVEARMKQGDLTEEEIMDYIDRYNHTGIEFRQKGQWQKAIDAYMSALKIDPANAAVHYNIGKAYVQGKNKIKAAQYYKKAISINEESSDPDPDLPRIVNGELKRISMV